MQLISPAWLTGLDASSMLLVENKQQLHQDVLPAYQQLQQAAAQQGFKIRLVSGWRSFSRQAVIWDRKCSGLQPVYDLSQQPVTISELSGLAKLQAILLYSALPGASRHHWGTDFDIYDAAAVSADYQVQLSTAEYAPGGPFYQMHCWLTEHMTQYGFFRPYQRYQGGIAAEPWHLSYQPLAATCLSVLTPQILADVLTKHPIAEQTDVLAAIPDIYQQFVINICEDA